MKDLRRELVWTLLITFVVVACILAIFGIHDSKEIMQYLIPICGTVLGIRWAG